MMTRTRSALVDEHQGIQPVRCNPPRVGLALDLEDGEVTVLPDQLSARCLFGRPPIPIVVNGDLGERERFARCRWSIQDKTVAAANDTALAIAKR